MQHSRLPAGGVLFCIGFMWVFTLAALRAACRPKLRVLASLATDMCVDFMAVGAFMRGYRLWVPGNCVAAKTATAQRTALQHMERTLRYCTCNSKKRSSFKIVQDAGWVAAASALPQVRGLP